MRGPTDYRKWQEFLNLVRGFARLNGREIVNEDDLMCAMDLFQKSLQTMTCTFPMKALNRGIDFKQIELHKKLLRKFNDGNGHGNGTEKEISTYARKNGLANEWKSLKTVKLEDGSKLITEFPDGSIFVKNISWESIMEADK